MKKEQFYGSPMVVEWRAGNTFAIVRRGDHRFTWNESPDQKPSTRAGSLAEHTPQPVKPCCTSGLHMANEATFEMWDRVIGEKRPYLVARMDSMCRSTACVWRLR